jgi:hypothetical protein
MWLFTKTGYFSVVQDWGDRDTLHIRARFREDLERLKKGYAPGLAIHHTPRADYAYRGTLTRKQFVVVVAALAANVDYPNFKDKVTEEQGRERHNLYMDVWTTMSNAQRAAESRRQGHISGWTGVFPGDEKKQAELDAKRTGRVSIEAVESPDGSLFGHFAVIRCDECNQAQGARHLEGCSHAGEYEVRTLVQGNLVPPNAYARPISPSIVRDVKRAKKKAAKKNAKARKGNRR